MNMCRARPGPRCSNSGRKRHAAARKNLQKAQAQAQPFEDGGNDNPMPEKVAKSLHNAELRMEQANRVFYATPAGQEYLAEQIKEVQDSLPKRKPSPSKQGALRLWEEKQGKIERYDKLLKEGIARRDDSYKDYHEFISERPILRQEAINRGAEFSPRAQRNKSGIDYTTGKPQKVELDDLSDEQLQRASTWVETGADSAWRKEESTRPPKKIDGEEIGSKAADSLTKMTRLSMPDGSVVEGRHDMHVTENKDGKYVVSMRTTVATSFEDASPVDKNTQELGHMLTNTRGKDVTVKLGEFDSLHAATTRRGMIANNAKNLPDDQRVNFAGTIAQVGRSLAKARFANTNKKKGVGGSSSPQNRGWVVPQFRYQETDESQSTQQLRERRKQKEKAAKSYHKAMEKAGAIPLEDNRQENKESEDKVSQEKDNE